MPWDDGSMSPIMADAMRRVVAVRGSAVVLMFYVDVLELQDRLAMAQGEGEDLSYDEKRAIDTQHYHELVELHGRDYAQRFVRLWLLFSDYLIAVRKGAIARAAMKQQRRRLRFP